MTAHTPGPWRANVRDIQTAHEGQLIPYVVAKTGAYLLTNSDPEGVPEANAQLIAAAPDLLAACKRMLATWGSQDEDAVVAARDVAHAAIFKATGK